MIKMLGATDDHLVGGGEITKNNTNYESGDTM
jgi:hypothetical protein